MVLLGWMDSLGRLKLKQSKFHAFIKTGRQGATGEDGFDVQLQPEADMPCVICPAGPPGQRFGEK